MEWTEVIGEAIDYIEAHIEEEISLNDIAKQVHISPFYFHKGFGMLCGYSLNEYIRNRRMSLAGGELISGDATITELALKYGYDSPDSFTRAFSRFHGVSPSAVRKEKAAVKSFAPLKLTISLKGGYLMEYKITKKESFTVLAGALCFGKRENGLRHVWNQH